MAFIIEQFYDRVFYMALHRTGGRQDAEDLTQEIFIKVIQALPRLRQQDKFSAWLYRIALNRIHDFHRDSQRKKRLLSFFTAGTDPERPAPVPASGGQETKELPTDEFRQALEQFLKTLPRAEQEIFRLKYLDDLTIQEIAGILKKNESTVKTHLYRAIKKIRQRPSLKTMFSEGINHDEQ